MAEPSSTIIRGQIERITFRSADSTFGVLKVRTDASSHSPFTSESKELVTVVGALPASAEEGSSIVARGSWQVHPKFGPQFKAASVTESAPSTPEAIAAYLGSGAVKGFGPVLAERVVAAFGADTLRVLDDEIDRLSEVPGIGAKKLSEIRESWADKRNLRETMLFLHELGISPRLAQRIYQAYGERSIEKVKSNPYLLARDIWGVGFQTADKIALASGIEPDADIRIQAGLLHTLRRGSDDGHCFLPVERLFSKTESLLGFQNPELLGSGLSRNELEGDTIRDQDKVYLPALLQAETQLAEEIIERGKETKSVDPLPESILREELLNQTLTTLQGRPIRLSAEQQSALRLASNNSLIAITGGPGCGKTTVVRSVAHLFRRAGLNVRLAAPTGRAAQRLAEVCGMEASTIHRLLKFDPISRAFVHDPNTPLALDVLIVDESSMIDLPLAASLLRAVPKGKRVIFVGDADQLPSVGPGTFFADLLKLKAVPHVRLTTLFRRAEESAITQLAHEINAARIPHIPEPDGQTKSDAYFIPCSDPTEIALQVERLVVDQLPRKFDLKHRDITVLSPMNQGEVGIIALNRRLQQQLTACSLSSPKVQVGNLELRLGDRVVQRSNNYNICEGGVFNGDQGVIDAIDSVRQTVGVKLWDGRHVEYSSQALSQLDLAYALTIHRSQGSEVPAVILVMHESHTMLLERQLLYTAVTRAKRLLIVIGTKRALSLAVKRTRSSRRFTALIERVGG